MATKNNKIDLTKKPAKAPPAPKKRSWVPFAVGGALVLALGIGAAVLLGGPKKKGGGSGSGSSGSGSSGSGGSGSGGSGSGSGSGGSGSGSSSGGSSKPRTKWRGNGFPLRKHSNGSRVKALQRALVRQHGNVLPKYGADGWWGDELQGALEGAGWPTYYTRMTYETKIGSAGSGSSGQGGSSGGSGGGGSITNYHDAAWNLHQAGKKADWATANSILSRMKSVGDYLTIKTSFVTWNFRGLVSYTPLNAMFTAFPSRRTELTNHFKRMGLRKKSNGQWTTSGLGNLPARRRRLRSTRETLVWTEDDFGIRMPADMLLGEEIRTKAGFTEFINGNGERFFVHTSDVIFQ